MRAGAWAIAFVILAGCGKGAPPAPPPEALAARAAAEEWRRGKPLEGADATAAESALARAEQSLAAGNPNPALFREAETSYRDAIAARDAKREALYKDVIDARSRARALRTRLSDQQRAIATSAAQSGDLAEFWNEVRIVADRDVFKSERLLSLDTTIEKAEALFSGGRHAEAREMFAQTTTELDALVARLSEAETEVLSDATLRAAEEAVADMRRTVGEPAPASAGAAETALEAARSAAAAREFDQVAERAREASDLAAKAKGYRDAVRAAKVDQTVARRMLDRWLEIGQPENDPSRAAREKLREGDENVESDPWAASVAFNSAMADLREAITLGRAGLKSRLEELHTKKTPPPVPPDPLDWRKTVEGVQLALEWLAKHQDDDGRWSASGFVRHDPPGHERADVGGALYDPGVTGLALLCFFAAGYSDRGEGAEAYYAINIEMGLRYLCRVQAEDGVFGTRATKPFMYNHAIATIAMAEAARITGDPDLRKSAERAVRFIESARNTGFAWRYTPTSGENDTSVTVWCVEALAAAQAAGIAVDPAAFRGAIAWVDSATDMDGRTGYDKRGNGPSRIDGLEKRFPPARSQSTTAAGVLIRLLADEKPRNEKMIELGTTLMLDRPPLWSPADGTIDMCYWQLATHAIRLSRSREWDKWSEEVQEVALRWQVPSTGAHNAGSWDPIGAWGKEGGRVYSTAMMTLTLIESAKQAP